MDSAKRTIKRAPLSLDTKVKILNEVDKKERSKTEIAKQYNLSSSTMSTIIKNRGKIFKMNNCGLSSHRMRDRGAKWPALESALIEWIKKLRSKNIPIDGKLLRAQTETFALRMDIPNIRVSDGWIQKFKKRNSLVFRKLCGESGSVNKDGCDEWRNGTLQQLLSKYPAQDIYNADETGLLYKLLPDRSLVFQKETSAGGKRPKVRITLLVAANMTGSHKLPLLAIGKSKKPRCFKGIKTMPVSYKANSKSWMTSSIFETWVKELDRQMALKNRKILLIVDNCTAHPPIDNLRAVELAFLPPNMTSVIQPMDQGIILCLKKNYRRMLLNRIVLCLENDKTYDVTLLSALHLAKAAWDEVSSVTIENCFNHAGFVKTDGEETPGSSTVLMLEPVSLSDEDDEALVRKLRQKNFAVPDDLTFAEYTCADNQLQCVEEKTDEDIIANALEAKKDDKHVEESDDDERLQPTTRQAMDSLDLLRSFFEGYENSDKFLQMISELENSVYACGKNKQTQITDFFKA